MEALLLIDQNINDVIFKEKNLFNENGFKILRSFLFEGENITISKYYELLYKYDSNLVKNSPTYVEHVSYVWKITDFLFMLCDMTSQSHIKTKDGNIPCIKLKDNIFKHTTTTFTLDPFILHNFIEVANPQTSTPRYLYTYNSDEIIKSLENAVSESYKYSTNTYHTFYNINLSETKNKTIAFNKFYEALEKMINTACESDIKQFNKFINELNNLKDHGFSEERKQGIRDALPTDIKYKC